MPWESKGAMAGQSQPFVWYRVPCMHRGWAKVWTGPWLGDLPPAPPQPALGSPGPSSLILYQEQRKELRLLAWFC